MKLKQHHQLIYMILVLAVVLIIIAFCLYQINNSASNQVTNNVPEGQVMLTPAELANKQALIDQTLASPQVKLTAAQIKAKELLLKQLQTNK